MFGRLFVFVAAASRGRLAVRCFGPSPPSELLGDLLGWSEKRQKDWRISTTLREEGVRRTFRPEGNLHSLARAFGDALLRVRMSYLCQPRLGLL